MRREILIGFLLGFAIVFGGISLLRKFMPSAQAATAMGGTPLITVTGNTQSGQHDLLYVVDPDGYKVGVYELRSNVLNLRDVRNIRYDLQLDYYSTRQRPSVKQIIRKVKKR
ncbi:MAG: hypothetical protein D6805_06850 [Planctomycetota bacterium]|nr:MAG: hypothetical protein D6805_06850 [Planctomycetota bacterium]